MLAWHELAELQWRYPWAALLLLLPLGLGWLARRRQQRLVRYAEPHLQPWAIERRATGRVGRLRRSAEALAWLLLALAAAGPRLPALAPEPDKMAARQAHVIDVMVVLDVSASMSATDVAPDRLTRARLELQDLLPRLHGERLGLLLYAGQAGLLLPPTEDKALLARALQQAGPDLLDAPGTDLARALTLAREHLGQGADPARRRAVLLVSDAEQDSLQGVAGEAVAAAVEQLRAADMPLYVLVTASRAGALFELPNGRRALRDGQPVLSRPELSAYRRLAQRSGGDLAEVRDGDADWDQLYDDGLVRLPGAALPTGPVQAWRELYVWPLGLALLLLLWSGLPPAARPRAGGALLVLLLAGSLAAPEAQAADPPSTAQAAAQAYRAQQWAQALPLFERQGGYAGAMGAGAAAWQLRDHARAARHFSQALLLARNATERDDALYNLGNAHYAQERWLAAAQAWRAVLLSRPGHARAAANLVPAEAQLAKRAGTPMRGRRGFAVEGFVGLDGAVDLREEPLLLPELEAGARSAGATDVGGARLQADTGDTAQDVTLSPQQLQSGLLKLERLQERQRDLLRGLLKQDSVPQTGPTTGAAW
jgi:Ca-activated chloride channel family protein